MSMPALPGTFGTQGKKTSQKAVDRRADGLSEV